MYTIKGFHTNVNRSNAKKQFNRFCTIEHETPNIIGSEVGTDLYHLMSTDSSTVICSFRGQRDLEAFGEIGRAHV